MTYVSLKNECLNTASTIDRFLIGIKYKCKEAKIKGVIFAQEIFVLREFFMVLIPDISFLIY